MSLAMIGNPSLQFALAAFIGLDAGTGLLDGPDRSLANLVEIGQSRFQGVEAGSQCVDDVILRLQCKEGIQQPVHQTSGKCTVGILTPALCFR
jgi:hypothetical protein